MPNEFNGKIPEHRTNLMLFMTKKKTLKNPASFEDHPFVVGLNWSKKLIIKTFIICLILAFSSIFGYLLYNELKKPQVDEYKLPEKKQISGYKNYSNDYWGFKFQYPNSWWPVTGSFEDGEYFFASEPISFAKELGQGQAMLEIKTYNNYKGLSFADWLADIQNNYLAQGVIEQQNLSEFKSQPAIAYNITLKQSTSNTTFWKIVAISKTQNVKYLFILESDSRETSQKFENDFKNILDSLEFFKGFGVD